jgi:6-phosphogluconolactonase
MAVQSIWVGRAATTIAVALARAVAERGHGSLALAGGTTPRALHGRLADRALVPDIDWKELTIWFGDERCVPADDDASNYRMARDTLLEHVHVAPDRVMRIEGELGAHEAARRYHARLAAAPPLDVVVLGMGDDGHVASWFPTTPAFVPGDLAAASVSPKPPFDRVTLTPAALAAAHTIILLVSGAAKAARLAEVYAQLAAGAPRLPAARVTSASGPPRWFVDDAAASALPAAAFAIDPHHS